MPKQANPGKLIPNARIDLPPKKNGRRWNLNTLYTPQFCLTCLDMMQDGATFIEVVAEIGVSKETADNWRKNYHEWDTAVKMGLALCEAWWNKKAKQNLEYIDEKGVVKFRTEIYKLIKQYEFGAQERGGKKMIINVGNDADSEKVSELVHRLHHQGIDDEGEK